MNVIHTAKSFYHTHFKTTIDVVNMSFLQGVKLKSGQSHVSDLSILKLTAMFNGHRNLLDHNHDYCHVRNATSDLAAAECMILRMKPGAARDKLTLLLNTLESTREQMALKFIEVQLKQMRERGENVLECMPKPDPKRNPPRKLQWDFRNLSDTQRERINNDDPAPRPRRIVKS